MVAGVHFAGLTRAVHGCRVACAMLRAEFRGTLGRGLPRRASPKRSSPFHRDGAATSAPERGPTPDEQHVRSLSIRRSGLALLALMGVGLGVLRAAPGAEPQRRPEGQSSLLDAPRPAVRNPAGPREFYFTRAVYSSGYWWGRWAIDFPKADRQFMLAVNSLIDIDGAEHENPVRLDDPNIRRFPFLYALEVGDMFLSPGEVQGLRDYLLAGGFLVIDDFWGSWEWSNFEQQIRQVLPEYPIVDIPLDHPIFNTVYKIDEIIQVPAIRNYWSGQTWEQDGVVPHTRGIFDDQGHLMVFINWNTDLGDAWEWFERPEYPLKYSSFAVQMGVNFVVYAMSH